MQCSYLLDEFCFKLTKFEIVQQTNDIFRIFLENKGSIDDSRIRVEDWYRHLRKYSNRNYKWSLSRRIISFRGISPRSRRNPKQRHYTPIFLSTRYVCARVCVCVLARSVVDTEGRNSSAGKGRAFSCDAVHNSPHVARNDRFRYS